MVDDRQARRSSRAKPDVRTNAAYPRNMSNRYDGWRHYEGGGMSKALMVMEIRP